MLKEFGIEGLREDIGQRLANTSDAVAGLVENARKVDVEIEEMGDRIEKLKEELDKLFKAPKDKKEK